MLEFKLARKSYIYLTCFFFYFLTCFFLFRNEKLLWVNIFSLSCQVWHLHFFAICSKIVTNGKWIYVIKTTADRKKKVKERMKKKVYKKAGRIGVRSTNVAAMTKWFLEIKFICFFKILILLNESIEVFIIEQNQNSVRSVPFVSY